MSLSELILDLTNLEQRHGGNVPVQLTNGRSRADIIRARYNTDDGSPEIHIESESDLVADDPEAWLNAENMADLRNL